MKKFLFLFLCPFLLIAQVQIGDDINGEAEDDQSGRSVSLSSDGTILAVGAYGSDANGRNSGHVRVFENQSGSWNQIGDDIDGEALDDFSGWGVSLSSDGTMVAIGAKANDGSFTSAGHVRIFENESGSWNQIGDDIDGEALGDNSGERVSLSSDGTIVAIGARANDGNGNGSGHVRVFENQTGSWNQIGDDIDGEAAGDWLGNSISLSADGTIVAIGAPLNDGNGNGSGHVRVFENQSGSWNQIGDDIDGKANSDNSGESVSLSADGTIVAIGAIGDGETNTSNLPGYVRVFENQSGSWNQIGNDINGEADGDRSGQSVSLSSDGTIVAIGAKGTDGNFTGSGQVRIFKNQSGSWNQIGNDINGETAYDESGWNVSLSSDGTTVAIGAPKNDGNGSESGHVRVYDLTATLSIKSLDFDYFSFYPNPVKDVLRINLNTGIELKEVNIYNIQSQYLYSVSTSKIDVSNLSSGIYFVEVVTNKGKSAKKIVVE